MEPAKSPLCDLPCELLGKVALFSHTWQDYVNLAVTQKPILSACKQVAISVRLSQSEINYRQLAMANPRVINWKAISVLPLVTWFVCKYHRKPWDWHRLCKNEHLAFPLRFVLSNPEIPWHWPTLSKHLEVTVDEILASKEASSKIVWREYALNRHLTLEQMSKHKKILPIHILSYNLNLTAEFILANLDLSWDFWGLSRQPCLTADVVLAAPYKAWDINFLCKRQGFQGEKMKQFYLDKG